MDNWLEKKTQHEKMLTEWALEQKLIEPNQEVTIVLKVKKKRPKVTIKRWELTDSEWKTILALPWTDFQRTVLQIHRDAKGGIPKSTAIYGHFYGRNIHERGSPPSNASYVLMNRMFTHARLSFRFLLRYDKRRKDHVLNIAVCTFA